MKNLYTFLRKARDRQRSYIKYILTGVGILILGVIVAFIGNIIGGTAGTMILIVGLLITVIGATIVSPYGW